MAKLRCKTPEVARKEILAHLLACKLLRTMATIRLQLDAADRSHDETAELATEFLNFRSLPPITPKSVDCSKSCY